MIFELGRFDGEQKICPSGFRAGIPDFKNERNSGDVVVDLTPPTFVNLLVFFLILLCKYFAF